MPLKYAIKVTSDIVDIEHYSFNAPNNKDSKIHIVNITLKRPVSPEEARDIADLIRAYVNEFIKPNSNYDLVALSGRAPIWLYLFVMHMLHGTVANFGAFDPKVGGIVVVTVHGWNTPFKEAEVIPVPDDIRTKLMQ